MRICDAGGGGTGDEEGAGFGREKAGGVDV